MGIKWEKCGMVKRELWCEGGMGGGWCWVMIVILERDDGGGEKVKWVYGGFYK